MRPSRSVGTAAYGVRAPIIRAGDDLAPLVVDTLLKAQENGAFELKDNDIVGITESLLARAQGNYASVQDVTDDLVRQMPGDFVVLFPILSRNRFALVLKALAASRRKVTVMLSYPCDEVGNHLMQVEELDNSGVNPYTDILTEEDFRARFGFDFVHPFTGMDYIELYKSLAVDGNIEIILANDCRAALQYSPHILIAAVHDRLRLKRQLQQAGAQTILGLDDLLRTPGREGGHNPEYGLYGSNQAGDNLLKLFPRDSQAFTRQVQLLLKEKTGLDMEVMVYGDGAFKDPQGRIWELADPVVAPGFTDGLTGLRKESKMKYIVDNELAGLDEAETAAALRQKIAAETKEPAASLGTTPRLMTDLLGSLCDLVSGSGDKGTPIVLIQGYFDNFASN